MSDKLDFDKLHREEIDRRKTNGELLSGMDLIALQQRTELCKIFFNGDKNDCN